MSDLHLFEGFGVELEYMLVDRQSLEVQSACDEVLSMLAGGEVTDEHHEGAIAWSNELALHVIELKASEPTPSLCAVETQLSRAIVEIDRVLEVMDLRLLPTAMHPWMNPVEECRLWPHGNHEIYAAFDQIFGCKSHGWGNVQSVHLNLPFQGDVEFAQLHAAVRLVLPLLPALAASSPVVDGVASATRDSRLIHYAGHCQQVPSVTGDVIPEAIYDEATYRRDVFERIFKDIQPFDGAGVLQHEFLNARGAIARFDRGSIEIRLMDVQECPHADLAICAAVVAVLKALVSEKWTPRARQQQVSSKSLRQILDSTIADAEQAQIVDAEYLALFGFEAQPIAAGKVWQTLIDSLAAEDETLLRFLTPLGTITSQGTLASRILAALGPEFTRDDLATVYQQLAECLVQGEMFEPSGTR